jgi:hypothetical protein
LPKTRTVVFACVSLLALVSLNLQRIPRLLGERPYEAGRHHERLKALDPASAAELSKKLDAPAPAAGRR